MRRFANLIKRMQTKDGYFYLPAFFKDYGKYNSFILIYL